MKLASLKGGRDGQLVLVSRDLSRYVSAASVAPTLQAALDDWVSMLPGLQALSAELESSSASHVFDPSDCASPLPRAYQWLDGSAYINHVELVRQARGAELPDSFWSDPLMYQGASDSFLAPRDAIPMADETWGIDFEAEVAVITDDVPMGVSAACAGRHIQLLMLVNDISLRNLIPAELTKGLGFVQSKPSTAFSPVAISLDELGSAWGGNKVKLPILSFLNGQLFGKPDAGSDMIFDFAQLIAHAAKSRPLGAGTIVGSGTVSNKLDGGPGKPVCEGGAGYSCIAEQRSIETIRYGSPMTPFMRFGDQIRIDMRNRKDESLFGAIDQTVVRYDNQKG